MVYAKDMNQVAMQEITRRAEEQRKAHEEKMNALIAKTRQFCHSTLSRMIEDKAYDGQKCLLLYITAPDKDGVCRIVETVGPYKLEYKETIVLDKMKEILKDHAYNFESWTNNYCTYRGKYRYQDKWVDGFRIAIEW